MARAAKKLEQVEQIITRWTAALLLMKPANLPWKDADYLEVKKLGEYLPPYRYLSSLADSDSGAAIRVCHYGKSMERKMGYDLAVLPFAIITAIGLIIADKRAGSRAKYLSFLT